MTAVRNVLLMLSGAQPPPPREEVATLARRSRDCGRASFVTTRIVTGLTPDKSVVAFYGDASLSNVFLGAGIFVSTRPLTADVLDSLRHDPLYGTAGVPKGARSLLELRNVRVAAPGEGLESLNGVIEATGRRLSLQALPRSAARIQVYFTATPPSPQPRPDFRDDASARAKAAAAEASAPPRPVTAAALSTPEDRELAVKLSMLAALEEQLAESELALVTLRATLAAFESRYRRVLGAPYAELDELDAKIAEAEARLSSDNEELLHRARDARALASASALPPQAGVDEPAELPPHVDDALKQLYRDVAKRIHPDLATDSREREQRTRLMADANRAFAAGDALGLRAVLDEWHSSPDAVLGEGTAADLVRTIRKLTQVERRLDAIAVEIVALTSSELNKLRLDVDAAADEGRDLLAEIAQQLWERRDAKAVTLGALQTSLEARARLRAATGHLEAAMAADGHDYDSHGASVCVNEAVLACEDGVVAAALVSGHDQGGTHLQLAEALHAAGVLQTDLTLSVIWLSGSAGDGGWDSEREDNLQAIESFLEEVRGLVLSPSTANTSRAKATASAEYSHSRKAGNRGDVWKHAVLVAIARSVPPRDVFIYVESHCGAPVHQLLRGGEWERGVGHLAKRQAYESNYWQSAQPWVTKGTYPASWVFAAMELASRCARVEVRLADTSDDVTAACHEQSVPLAPNVHLDFKRMNGFDLAVSVRHASLVFLDPPFSPDAGADWKQLARVCQALTRQGTPFVAWYPFTWPTRPQRLVDSTGCEAWEAAWAQCGPQRSQNLKGCGMLLSAVVAETLRPDRATLSALAIAMGWEFRIRRPAAPSL